MAWPPPPLKNDYSNADPQIDAHVLAHNGTSNTLNDDFQPQVSTNIVDIGTNRTDLDAILENIRPGAAGGWDGTTQPFLNDPAGVAISRLHGTRGPYPITTGSPQNLTAGYSSLSNSTSATIPAVNRAGYAIVTATFDFVGLGPVDNLCQGQVQVQVAGGAWVAVAEQSGAVFGNHGDAPGRAGVSCVAYQPMLANTTYRFRLAAQELGGTCSSNDWTGYVAQVFT